MAEVTLRPATVNDASAMNSIHKYYVTNTVITFQFEPFDDEEFAEKYKKVKAENLPFLVAELRDGSLAGFCSASHFRSAKLGYRHTAELSLFCHPDYQGKGVGSQLLTHLITILRNPSDHAQYMEPMSEDRKIIQILACMAIDEKTPRRGDELKDFYTKFGFVERGHLHRVGHKFDRWIDTRYMQLEL